MKSRIRFTVLLFTLSCFIFVNSAVSASTEPTAKEVLKDFKQKIAEFVSNYSNNRKSDVHKLGGGWVSQYYEVANDYSIDVQATNSLISPYTATCEFKITRHMTDFHKNKIDAELDINYTKAETLTHKHYYAYQDDEWVVVDRKHLTYIPLRMSAPIDSWDPCSDYLGCREKNFKGHTK